MGNPHPFHHERSFSGMSPRKAIYKDHNTRESFIQDVSTVLPSRRRPVGLLVADENKVHLVQRPDEMIQRRLNLFSVQRNIQHFTLAQHTAVLKVGTGIKAFFNPIHVQAGK